MPDGWQICTNGRKVPTAVGDFGLGVFGCLALECAIYPVYRISLIVIWRCDLMILIWWPHDLKKGGEKRNREVNKSNSGAAEHESRMLTVRKCVSMARKIEWKPQ
jgi:hypothetical protein